MSKNKNQSIYMFFESLQKEYMIAMIRSKIYTSYRNRKYYRERVMPGKKEKIEQIAQRSGIRSIFDDKEIWESVWESVVPQWGLPNFTYSSDENREEQYPQDYMNYFSPGSEVVVNDGGKAVVGVVVSNDFLLANNMVDIKRLGSEKVESVSISLLKRIL